VGSAETYSVRPFRGAGPLLFVGVNAGAIWGWVLLLWGASIPFARPPAVPPPAWRVALWATGFGALDMSGRFREFTAFSRAMWRISALCFLALAVIAEYAGALSFRTRATAGACVAVCAQALSLLAVWSEIRRRRRARAAAG